jgi:adenylate cyclase
LKLKRSTIIGLVITFSVIIAYLLDPAVLKFMELKSLDLKFQTRGILQPGKETVIAAIDEKSLDELGRWPWSRNIQARLVNKLTEHGARVIAFDAVFSEPDTNPGLAKIRDFKNSLQINNEADPTLIKWLNLVEDESDTDQQFADSLRKSQRTVLGYFFHFSETGLEHLGEELLERSFENIQGTHYNAVRFASEEAISAYLQHAYAVESNISILSEAASSAGFFSFVPDYDGAFRRIPLIVSYKDYFFPPLSIQSLKLYLDKQVSFYIPEYGMESVEIGDILIPTDKQGKLLINYYGPPNTFPHYSITDIINDRIPEDFLKDKIVIVGATAVGIYDLRITPFEKNYPGVEIHATVIDNILHQRFLVQPEWAKLIDLSAILIGGVIVTFVFAKASVFPSLGYTFLAGCFFLWFNYFLFQQGIQCRIISPLLNLVLVYAGITIYRLFTEGKEKRFIKGAFGQYLSPIVIEQLVAYPDLLKLGGERKILTAFFSDVAGFAGISEKLSPEELVELLNVYLTEMTDIIMKYEGTVDKFEGDAIISFFGAPLPLEDHAKRACLASLEMQKRLQELRMQWKREGKQELYVRIGLNTGPMVVGNMGSKSRMDYTIMGDSVNLASRLEGANKYYGTYSMISESTYNAAREVVEVRRLDRIRVIGKAEPVTVYELICTKGGLEPQHAKQIALFHDGLSYYLEQQWDKAMNCFQTILEKSSDSPSSIYIERCKKLKIKPPGSNWDGVFSLTEK